MKNRIKYNKKNQIADLILLLFPHIALFCALLLVCAFLYGNLIEKNAYFRLAVIPQEKAVPIDAEIQDPTVIDGETLDELPIIDFESQWATLNIEGWKTKDIPVYFGDNDRILSKGAGLWFGSFFPGQEGKTIISGHVTSCFYEIEDSKIGDKIVMDTVYGRYEYQVRDIVRFRYDDDSYLLKDVDGDTLILYTCYPRENGLAFKTERIALECERISGKEYAK